MNSHGGARPGAGRKPKALRYASELAAAEGKIVGAAPKIIDALIRAAEQGDAAAGRYLLDRVFGRVREQTHVLAEDATTPTDEPRLATAWGRQARERDAAEWIEEVHSRRDDVGRLQAQIADTATKVEWARARMDDGEWRSFEEAQRARLVEVERITAEEPRAQWQRKLADFDRRQASGPGAEAKLLKLAFPARKRLKPVDRSATEGLR